MRGLLVELSRFRARRAIVGLFAALIVLTAVVAGSLAYQTRAVSDTEQAKAERAYAKELGSMASQIETCRADPEEFFGGPAGAETCDEIGPQLDWFLPRPRLDVAEQTETTGPGLSLMLAAMGLLIGATFTGADWGSGSMVNQLLFRPRRLRLWLTKATAVVTATVLGSGVIMGAFWLFLTLLAGARGLEVTQATVNEIWQGTGRGLGLVAAATLGGFALTMLLRRTGGTIGAVFGYAVVSEVLVGSLPFTKVSQWSLLNSLSAWLTNGTEVYDDSICSREGCNPFYTLTFGHAAAYLLALLVLAVVVSVVSFRRRDVS